MVVSEGFKMARIPELRFGPGKIGELFQLLGKYPGTVLMMTGGNSFRKTQAYAGILEQLGSKSIPFLEFRMPHEPDVESLESILKEVRPHPIAVVLAIGGGSVLDAGKALSLLLCQKGNVEMYLEKVGNPDLLENRKIPCIAVPTTAGTGSEATKNAVITVKRSGIKVSLRHESLVPEHVILDPTLQLDLPKPVAAASGMDALTQLLESYFSSQANPMTDLLAMKGISLIHQSFPNACLQDDPTLESKGKMSLAAYFSGITLANAGLGLVHGFAGIIGGETGLAHGKICGTLMLPVMERLVSKAKLVQNLPFLEKWNNLKSVSWGEDSHIPIEDASFFELWKGWLGQSGMDSFQRNGINDKKISTWASKADNKNALISLDEQERLSLLRNVFREGAVDG